MPKGRDEAFAIGRRAWESAWRDPHGKSVSDFPKAGLSRQFLNIRALDPGVAIRGPMQLYKGRGAFSFRQPVPPPDTLCKRARAIDMGLPDE